MRIVTSLIVVLGLAAAALPIAGCGRYAPGFIVTSDGRTVANNDENTRQLAIDSIRTQLDADLGGHWRTAVTIPELPVYAAEDHRIQDNGGWRWDHLTATVTLVGDGTVPLPLTTDAVHTAVTEYLSGKVDHPHRQLTVTVTAVTDPARFASLNAPVGKKDPTLNPVPITLTSASAPRPAAAQRYVVQAGDTWADLSSAFYNTPQHWKLIRDANPGVTLAAGVELTIPPKP